MAARQKATPWIVGTVLLVALILAGGFMLVVNPVLAEASQTRESAAQMQDANSALQARIVSLKKQYDQLDTDKANLAALRTQIPSTEDTANLLRGLQSAAAAAGVSLISVTPGTASEFASTAAPAQTSSSDAAAADTQDPSAAAPTASSSGTAAASSTGLVAIPLAIDMVGTYASALGFLDAVQATTGRLYFVTSVDVSSQQDGNGGGGRPATTVGDAELQLNGYVFVLPASQAAAAPSAAATPAPLPAAVPGKNPLVPVGG